PNPSPIEGEGLFTASTLPRSSSRRYEVALHNDLGGSNVRAITRRWTLLGAIFAFVLGAAPAALAAETQVAVAANFTEPAKEIAEAFAKATGHKAILSFGSSGQFYTQMAHGAPYEVFLSADAERPAKAEKDGLAVPNTRFTYAVG